MNRRCLRLLVLAAIFLSSYPVAAQQDAPPRQVRSNSGKHVRAAIRPGDKAIELVYNGTPGLTVHPSEDMSLSKWLFDLADAVVLARVDRRQSRLTSAGDWVLSDIAATLIEVFKAPEGANWKPNATMTFVEGGGELQVDDVKVTAVVPWGRGLKAGGTYLFTVAIHPDSGRILLDPRDVYELSDGRFTNLTNPADRLHELDKIEGDLSGHVLSEFRELGRASRQP